eukprot:3389230-Ditylum_brightwellii.AAC.1
MKRGHAAVNKAYSRLSNFLSINMKDSVSSGTQAFVLARLFMSCVVVTVALEIASAMSFMTATSSTSISPMLNSVSPSVAVANVAVI